MKKPKVLPPTYFFLSLVGMFVLHFSFPVRRIIPSPWNAIGVIFLMSGIALSLLGDRLFHRAGTTIKPFEESTSLVTQGVFRLSRNPMYLGFILLLAGAAFLMGSLAPFLVIPLFIFLIYTLFIKIEEKMLTEKFGKSYLDYQKRVRRWI